MLSFKVCKRFNQLFPLIKDHSFRNCCYTMNLVTIEIENHSQSHQAQIFLRILLSKISIKVLIGLICLKEEPRLKLRS